MGERGYKERQLGKDREGRKRKEGREEGRKEGMKEERNKGRR